MSYASPSEQQQESKSVYVFPPAQEGTQSRPDTITNFAVLADGNNRRGGNYETGGDNVVRVAESILTSDSELQSFIALILSPDNIQKRSPEFLEKITKAFIALGVKIITSDVLKDIAIEFSGDLESLEQHNEIAQELVEAMQYVRKLANDRLSGDGSKKLILGVNYPPDILQQLDVQLLYRSGMEEEKMARFGSVHPDEDMLLAADTDLWPDVDAEKLTQLIQRARDTLVSSFEDGFETEHVCALLKELVADDTLRGTITIPCKDDLAIVSNEIAEVLPVGADILRMQHVINVQANVGPSIRLIAGYHTDDRKFDGLILPDNQKEVFSVPKKPQINYTNIFRCDHGQVVSTIQKSLQMRYKQLQGAERNTPQKDSADEERSYYLEIYQSDAPFEEDHHTINDVEDFAEQYNKIADAFVAHLMAWGREIGIPTEASFQFRAVVNYYLTSLFMVYAPHHPAWEQFGEAWQRDARALAQYMGAVYMGDELIFDALYDDEDNDSRTARIKASAQYLENILLQTQESHECPITREQEVLLTIGSVWRSFIEEFEPVSHPQALQAWRTHLANLYTSSVKEWDADVTHNPLLDMLFEDNQQSDAEYEITETYMRHMPHAIASHMQELINVIKNNKDDEEARFARARLNVYTYLFDVQDSIGAGIAYRTVALTVPSQEMSDEALSLIDDVCLLANFYFRIMNDIAGFFKRVGDDTEDKPDAVTIIEEASQHESQAACSIESIAILYQMAEEIEQELFTATELLKKHCPKVAMSVVRSAIAKDIYKEGHYRTLSRQHMSKLFEKHQNML